MSRQCTSAVRMAVRSGCIRIVMKSACTSPEKASAAVKCHRTATWSGKSPLPVALQLLLALELLQSTQLQVMPQGLLVLELLLLAPLLVVQQSLPLPVLWRLPPLLVALLSLLALELLLNTQLQEAPQGLYVDRRRVSPELLL